MNKKDNNSYQEKSLQTYLPLSEQCLKPKFLGNQHSLNTFIRLIKESHENTQKNPHVLSAYDNHRRPISQILSEMPGLTEEQKVKAIETAKHIDDAKKPKKMECQF